MATTELAVIGAGPAGLAAAVAAAQTGVQVTLLDESPRPGGQYLKGAAAAEATPASATDRQGRALLQKLAGLPIELRLQTLVWGIEGKRLALAGPAGLDWLEAGAIITATGARELVIPFPGWTLPGVLTLGAAQVLAKEHSVLPGRRILLAGSGPLLLPVANQLARQGAEVVAVLEATRPSQWLTHAGAVWDSWDRLVEGWHYLRGLRRAGIPYRFGQTVIRALDASPSPTRGGPGRGQELAAVVAARLDRQGHPIPGSEETVAVDTLCVGFGFTPNIELTQLAGCAHRFDPARGGWTPQVDERQETSQPGLFVAGESGGVGGAAAAIVEGLVAGLAAAQQLGRLSANDLAAELAQAAGPRRRLRRFGAMLNTLFAPPPGLNTLITADTVVCRCEEITAAEVRAAAAQGAVTLDALKTHIRVGQGPCQGRICGPLLSRLISQQTGSAAAEIGCFRIRPPLKPVLLGELAGGNCP